MKASIEDFPLLEESKRNAYLEKYLGVSPSKKPQIKKSNFLDPPRTKRSTNKSTLRGSKVAAYIYGTTDRPKKSKKNPRATPNLIYASEHPEFD